MIVRLTIFILLLSSTIQAFPEFSKLPQDVANELKKAVTYKEGVEAINHRLPEIAVSKFRQLLNEDTKWSNKTSSYISLSLAEALLRNNSLKDDSDALATEALAILESEALAKIPSTPLWRAEALAALNRYQDASESLFQIESDHPLYDEVLITRARLLIAMTRYDAALAALKTASQSKSLTIVDTALLLTAEVNLTRKNYTSMQKSLEKVSSTDATNVKLKSYLLAQLSLQLEESTDSVAQFQALLENPTHLSETLYHSCYLGLADAYEKEGKPEEAIDTLETFIAGYTPSHLLSDAFSRLSRLLPPDLPAEHPSISKLREWSPTYNLEPLVIYPDTNGAKSVPYYRPRTNQSNDLEALALYHRAVILAKSEKTQNRLLALELLNRLRTKNFPSNQQPSQLYMNLQAASLIDTANLQLLLDKPEAAAFTLSLVDSISTSTRLKDQANIVRGLLLHEANDLERSLAAFQTARRSAASQVSSSADINAGITALKASKLEAFQKILDTTAEQEVKISLMLERALWKSSQGELGARKELEAFLLENPQHQREQEARLSLAEAYLNIDPQNIEAASEQLVIITPKIITADNQYRLSRAQIKIAESKENWIEAATSAEAFITKFPKDPRTPTLILKRGASYFQNEDYNQARLIFKELADEEEKTPLSNYANFYSAMSARLGGTVQAKEESVTLFQNVIDYNGKLATESRIQQGRILIDLKRYTEAESALAPLLKDEKIPFFHQIDAGILMADCLYRQGTTDATNYEKALQIYDRLLAGDELPLGKKNRIHYLKGKTYESMAQSDKAFESYYSVMASKRMPETSAGVNEEWKWFYQCSFQALSILESDSRWEAAVKLARNIAKFQGPRAEEATNRANNIAKNHMIWEETDPISTEKSEPATNE